MQIKKIVVASEFTTLSDKALEFALAIAKRLQHEEIILLNMILPLYHQNFYAHGDPEDYKGQLTDNINSAVIHKHEDLIELQALKYSASSVRIVPVVKLADSIKALNDYMIEFKADLLISGNHEEKGLPEILFGSHTDKMVRKIQYPTIIVSEEAIPTDIRLIALAIHADENEDISDIVDFASQMNAHLDLVHINKSGNGNKVTAIIAKLEATADTYRLKDYSVKVFNNESVEEGLKKYANQYNPDIIAIIAHGHGKLYKMVFGSKAEEIIDKISVPVFVCKGR
jgi:nucleotide-binding universal stress UspA family protein